MTNNIKPLVISIQRTLSIKNKIIKRKKPEKPSIKQDNTDKKQSTTQGSKQ